MKNTMHAVAGVTGFLMVLASLTATAVSLGMGDLAAIATTKTAIFYSTLLLPPLLAAAGATGMSMLGTRTEPKAQAKQQRGPIGFMTSLFVLLPSSWLLSSWASAGPLDAWFYGVQALEVAGTTVVAVMVGLNIRDGLMLRGRIAAGGAATPSIEERNGGPLVAMGLPSLVDGTGTSLEASSVMALCRCGHSKNKPFCDGSHNTIEFDTTPSDDRTKDEVLTYEGTVGTIHYNRLLCSHAAECGRRQKAAFDTSRTPWIVPDNAPREGLLEVVKACPSGALRFADPGEAPEQARSDVAGIQVEKNGPYRVTAVPLASARLAAGANPDKYVLCRCGASKNKPFCDGSHYDIGWSDAR